MLPGMTQERYNLLIKLFESRDASTLLSIVKSFNSWQKVRILSPSILIIGYFINEYLYNYQIKSLWSVKPEDFQIPEPLTRGTNSRIQVIESPAIALGISEKLSELRYPIQLATVRGLIEDLVKYSIDNEIVDISIEKKVWLYADKIEESFEHRISSKKISEHFDSVMQMALSIDHLLDDIENEYDSKSELDIEVRRVICRIKTQHHHDQKKQLVASNDYPTYNITRFCRAVRIHTTSFHQDGPWKDLIKDSKKRDILISVNDFYHILRTTLSNSEKFKSKMDLINELGGKKIFIRLPKKFFQKLQDERIQKK